MDLSELVEVLDVSPSSKRLPDIYSDWNNRIVDYFFGEDVGDKPVFLCLDEETIQSELDGSPQEFRAAVRSLGSPDEICDVLARLAVSWARGDPNEPPPFVAGLALFVLAACRMGEDPGVAPHDYYTPLAREFGTDPAGRPSGFAEMRVLWCMLNRWLSDVCGNRRGRPTARQLVEHYTHIGWPLSQALVRPADRDALRSLQELSGIEREGEVDTRQMGEALRVWLEVGGPESRLADVLRGALGPPDEWSQDELEPTAEVLGEILPHLDPHPESGVTGTVPESATRRSPADLRLYVPRWDHTRAYLAWKRRDEEPGRYEAVTSPGEKEGEVEIRGDWVRTPVDLSDTGWGEVRVSVGALDAIGLFDPGDGGGFDPVFFQRDGPGWWHQSETLGPPHTEQCILCPPGRADRLRRALSDIAASDPEVVEPAWAPDGWVLLAGVELESAPAEGSSLGKHSNADPPTVDLEGGIRVGRQEYLAAEPPTVHAPTTVTVETVPDGSQVSTLAPGTSLEEANLGTGTYRLVPEGGKPTKIRLRKPRWPPMAEPPFDPIEVAGPDGGTVAISGTPIRGQGQDRPPLVLDRGTPVVVLGRRPGEFKRLSDHDGERGLFETDLSFEPQWVLELERGKPVRIRAPGDSEPDPPGGGHLPGETQARRRTKQWCQYILSGPASRVRALPPEERAVYDDYMQEARRMGK